MMETALVLIALGTLLSVSGAFFLWPGLLCLFGLVAATDEDDARIKRTYRPVVRTLLFLGLPLLLAGAVMLWSSLDALFGGIV